MIAFLILIFTSSAVAAESVQVSFDELPKLVTERNQHVKGAESFALAAESQTGHLVRSYLPNLEAHVGGERFNTGSFPTKSQPYGAIEARVNVFRGGRDSLESQIRNEQVDQSRASFQQAYSEELTKARRAFWTMVYQRELVSLISDAIKQNEQNLSGATRKIKAGLATETDRLEFDMYRVQLEQDFARAALGVSNSQRTLNVLIGNADDTRVETVESIPHQHDDALLKAELNTDHHRDVRSLSANQSVAELQKSQAYRWWTPSVDVYGGYGLFTLRERDYENLADRYETVVGARLTLNVFDGWQSRTQGRGMALQAEGYENQKAQTARELRAQFEGAKQELNLTHELIHASEKSVEQAKQYLLRTQSEYARGVKNSPDVFSATEKYIDMKRRYADIRKDYQIAKTELLALLGK